MSRDEEDKVLRDFLAATVTFISDEEMERIKQEAPWIKVTDEGFECSKGMIELIHFIFGDKNENRPD